MGRVAPIAVMLGTRFDGAVRLRLVNDRWLVEDYVTGGRSALAATVPLAGDHDEAGVRVRLPFVQLRADGTVFLAEIWNRRDLAMRVAHFIPAARTWGVFWRSLAEAEPNLTIEPGATRVVTSRWWVRLPLETPRLRITLELDEVDPGACRLRFDFDLTASEKRLRRGDLRSSAPESAPPISTRRRSGRKLAPRRFRPPASRAPAPPRRRAA